MGLKYSENHPLIREFNKMKLFDGLTPPEFDNPYAELPEFIVSRGVLTHDKMLDVLKCFYGLPSVKLDSYLAETETLSMMTEEICKEMMILPLAHDDNRVALAMADPWDLDARSYVEMKTGKAVDPVVGLKSEIIGAVDRLYGATDVLSRAISDLVGTENAEDMDASKSSNKPIEWEDAPVIKLVNYIFQQGVSLRASDIHLEPQEKGSSLRYRIDGALHAFSAPPHEMYKAVVARVKVLANMNVSENRFPQDGRIRYTMGVRAIDFRVSTIPFSYGEGVNIRILDKSRMSLDLNLLGFPEDSYNTYIKSVNSPHGLVLIAGPTGSGKTTTLYATLKLIATPDKKVISVEDPVEYQMKGVQQSTVREDIGYTFARGLKAILRHDPDIIMIGEMRDLESAEMAVRSALTGHLVLSTIHTNDSVQAITRLVDMGIADYLVPAVLQMVVSQRLVRRLCIKCRQEALVEKARFEELGLDKASLAKLDDQVKVYRPKGCDSCSNIGFMGRIAIYEVLDTYHMFRAAKVRRMAQKDMTDLAISLGMRTLRASGLKEVISGITSISEILKVTADY